MIALKIYESAENYLETILLLQKQNNFVRAVDIANELGFSKPSVSVAMKNLREKNLILISTDGNISLTQSGLEIAQKVFERHTVISNWLISLGVDQTTAVEDACRIEHVISEDSFNALKSHTSKTHN